MQYGWSPFPRTTHPSRLTHASCSWGKQLSKLTPLAGAAAAAAGGAASASASATPWATLGAELDGVCVPSATIVRYDGEPRSNSQITMSASAFGFIMDVTRVEAGALNSSSSHSSSPAMASSSAPMGQNWLTWPSRPVSARMKESRSAKLAPGCTVQRAKKGSCCRSNCETVTLPRFPRISPSAMPRRSADIQCV
eukprot:scaffold27422_cov70-Phaeocystis_antarctica.AAC.7